VYACNGYRTTSYPDAPALDTWVLLETGAVMGCALAVYAMQSGLLHLKFPEIQRSRHHIYGAKMMCIVLSHVT
jgi:hypothetical protein